MGMDPFWARSASINTSSSRNGGQFTTLVIAGGTAISKGESHDTDRVLAVLHHLLKSIWELLQQKKDGGKVNVADFWSKEYKWARSLNKDLCSLVAGLLFTDNHLL